jgi:hypothetical protein
MADSAISSLSAASSGLETHELAVNESSTSKKVTARQIIDSPKFIARQSATRTLTNSTALQDPFDAAPSYAIGAFTSQIDN